MVVCYDFEQLDVTSSADRTAYERAFFEAFRREPGNRLVRDLWIWDEGQRRVRTRVPYEDQRIYVLRRADRSVAMGFAVNVAMRTFQSAAHGFPVPNDLQGCCEFLAFFGDDDYSLERTRHFFRRSCADLRSRGFFTGYGTAAPRWLAYYCRIGFATIADTRTIDEETYDLLKFNIAKAGGRP